MPEWHFGPGTLTTPLGEVFQVLSFSIYQEDPVPNPIMKYFEFSHLPPPLAAVSGSVYALACEMEQNLPNCAEKSAGLRKLLEAKDCFVRAALEPKPPEQG